MRRLFSAVTRETHDDGWRLTPVRFARSLGYLGTALPMPTLARRYYRSLARAHTATRVLARLCVCKVAAAGGVCS